MDSWRLNLIANNDFSNRSGIRMSAAEGWAVILACSLADAGHRQVGRSLRDRLPRRGATRLHQTQTPPGMFAGGCRSPASRPVAPRPAPASRSDAATSSGWSTSGGRRVPSRRRPRVRQLVGRRPETAQAGHLIGEAAARVRAQGRPEGGAAVNGDLRVGGTAGGTTSSPSARRRTGPGRWSRSTGSW